MPAYAASRSRLDLLDGERAAQRPRLAGGDHVEQVEHRPHEGMQGRERNVALGLGPGDPEDHGPVRPVHGLVQERRLADARPAHEHERPTPPEARLREHPADQLELAFPTDQHPEPLQRLAV